MEDELDSVLCMRCRQPALNRVDIGGQEFYVCRNCAHRDGRALFTEGLRIDYLPNGDPKHYSVGMLVRDGDRFLIIKRRVWPYKHGVPAGHVDAGESREQALVREMGEELDATPSAFEVAAHEANLVGDRCRKGADVHDWTLYSCHVDVAAIKNNSDEAERLMWVTVAEASELDFAFASGHMLRKIGLLN